MTDEERQRTMDFILQQMAQITAGAQRNEEERQKREQKDARRDVSIEQIRRLLARSIWERRRDRRDWNERMAALVNSQMRADERDSHLDEKMNALISAQMRSEERQSRAEARQSRTEEWQSRMEESFARADARMTRVEADAERNSKDIAALLVTTERTSEVVAKLAASDERNSAAIEKLTAIAADLARRRGNDEGSV